MMSNKTILCLLILAVAAFCIGCNNETTPLIVAVLPTSDNPYWLDMKAGIEAAGRTYTDLDVQVITGNADDGAREQNEHLTALLPRGLDALIVGPASGTEIVGTVAEFKKRGVHVVVVDSRLDQDLLNETGTSIDVFIGSRNRQGGEKAAERIQALIGPGEKNVLLLEGNPVHETAIARQTGFLDASPAEWKINEQRADWNGLEANRIVRAAILQAIPDAIFAASDEMALGAVQGLLDASVSSSEWPAIVGFDATEEALVAIEAGQMCATIRQRPHDMGSRAVEAAWQLIQDTPGIRGDQLIDVEVIPNTIADCGKERTD